MIVAAVIALVVVAVLLALAPTTLARARRARTVRRYSTNEGCPGQWWPEPEVPVARLPPLLTSFNHHL